MMTCKKKNEMENCALEAIRRLWQPVSLRGLFLLKCGYITKSPLICCITIDFTDQGFEIYVVPWRCRCTDPLLYRPV